MTTNPHIAILLDFANRLMDGEPVPATDSEALTRIQDACRGFLAGDPPDYRQFGGKVFGLILDRCIASNETEQLLRGLGEGS